MTGRYADRLTEPLPGYRAMSKIIREGGFGVKDLSEAARIPVVNTGLPALAPGETSVTWVGHASYVVRTGSLTVLTDPVWSRKIPGVRARLTPPGVGWTDLPPVDVVVISHNHYDHLDAPTINRLPRDTRVLVPAALGRWFRRRGFTRVTELDWWESVQVDGVTFEFVPSHHWSRRGLLDTCDTLWGGWVIGTSTSTIYFAGDTGYGDWFARIGEHHGGIDLALMPVGAYEPRWFMRSMHVNPEEAVRACDDLGARQMATMHWGTFVLSAEPLLAPVEEAAKAWATAGRPRDDLWDLAVGETRILHA